MDPFIFQNQGINHIDILVLLDKKLGFLADALMTPIKKQAGLFIYGELEAKKILFFTRADSKMLSAAKSLGARTAIIVQTVKSLNDKLCLGDVLLLDAQDGVYDSSLLVHLAPAFGVKKGFCVSSPKESEGLRLLGFRLVTEKPQEDADRMKDILKHLLVCTTANL